MGPRDEALMRVARLFSGIGPDVGVELVETIASPRVTHVRYAVRKA